MGWGHRLRVVAATAVMCGTMAPAAAADPSVGGVWSNQFGNVLVGATGPTAFAGRMLQTFDTPSVCPHSSHVVVIGQQVWTFAATSPGAYSGTFNYIRNGDTPGCPGGNSELDAVSQVIQGATPYKDVLRICHADPDSGAAPVFDPAGDANCENEDRLGLPAAATAKHSLSDYLLRITGGGCVNSGPRVAHVKFRDDYTVAGAPGIGDPIVKLRFYDRTKHDKGYDVDNPVDVPGSSTSGNFNFETNTLQHLYIKVVMTSASGKVYTADTRHLSHAMLPKPLPQHCKKTSNNS